MIISPEQSHHNFIEIGTIVAPQGLKGEVRVNPSSDFPERFEQPGMRWLQYPRQQTPQQIELLEGYQIPGRSLYILKLAGICDRNQAESLRGCKLLVSTSDRPELDDDEYHVADLINLVVYHQITKEKIGIVTEIFVAGNDLLEVTLDPEYLATIEQQSEAQEASELAEKPTKATTVLIPFVKDIVTIVNLESGYLEINPPQGLLEITN